MPENNPFVNSEHTTILVVSDISISKKLYLNVLGAELFREHGGTSMVIKFLNNWILIVTSGGPTNDKPETSYNPPQNPKSVSHSFTIRVEDCDKSYQELISRGAEFITPPYNWGEEIRCFFKDPDEHLFEISQAIKQKT